MTCNLAPTLSDRSPQRSLQNSSKCSQLTLRLRMLRMSCALCIFCALGVLGALQLLWTTGAQAQPWPLEGLIAQNTPYLFGGATPLTEPTLNALARSLQETSALRDSLFKELEEQTSAEERARLEQTLNALTEPQQAKHEQRALWRERGFERPPYLALYGVGLFPRLSVTIDDHERFAAWVSALFTSDQTDTKGKRSPQPHFVKREGPQGVYWRRSGARWTLIAQLTPLPAVGAKAGLASLTLIPKLAEATMLSRLLSPPDEPLTHQGYLERFKGLSSNLAPTGWLSIKDMLGALLAEPAPHLKASASALGLPLSPSLTGACGAEVMSISSLLSQLTLATDGSSTFESLITLSEEAQNLLSAFTQQRAPFPPSSVSSPAPALEVSLALNLKGLHPLAQRLSRWSTTPWSCPLFQSLNRLAVSPDALTLLASLTPFLSAFEGLQLHLSEPPHEENLSAHGLTGWLSLRHRAAPLLWSIIQAQEQPPRWLQGVTLPPQGQPVTLKDTPKSWRAPQLSLSPQGLTLSLDADSAQVHALHHQHLPSQPTSTHHQEAPQRPIPLIEVSYTDETLELMSSQLTSLRDRAKRLAQSPPQAPTQAPALGSDQKGTQTESHAITPTQRDKNPQVVKIFTHKKGILIRADRP